MNQRSNGDGFTASHAAVVGRYTYRPDTDQWWWSDTVFRIHGFEPGTVVPTTELVIRHMHPEDRSAAWDSRESAIDRHEPFSFLHRIITATKKERVVIAAGHLENEVDGTPVVVGHLVDLTDVRRSAVAQELDTAVLDFADHRAVIEQAKGVLAQLYSVDVDTAFALLKAFSMDANVKIRDVATTLVTAASTDLTPSKGRAPSVHDLLEQLRGSRTDEGNPAPVG